MTPAAAPAARLEPVLAAYGAAGSPVAPLGAGLINQTFVVDAAQGRFVLQRLHPVFPAGINADIDVVTCHLAGHGLVTPRLLRTVTGALWVEQDGAVWRALTWIDGLALDRLEHPGQAREAGLALARFHHAVADLQHRFHSQRPGVHDTARHLANLRDALLRHAGHRRFDAVAPLAERILAAAARLPALEPVPERIVHGDPKVGNILFSRDGQRAICLVDLDTLAHMQLPLELGDAFRSWCNPAGEDQSRATFSLELFRAAVGGYAEVAAGFISAAEWRSLVSATRRIYVELAARFCADALQESYFGWDSRRFSSASEHNQRRAESQMAAAGSLEAQTAAAEAVVRQAFAG
ncbi:MAG: hypothetical protein BroJett010_12520 [Gammaproteobacteria bacterium]|nr:MAG: hypothetical protein BroJett010_12520 [Gammaproteobacteria bacterium]